MQQHEALQLSPPNGGDPAFVAAHWITNRMARLSFEHAWLLTRLVMHADGGPMPVKGREALSDAKALTSSGLTRLEAHSILTEAVDITAIQSRVEVVAAGRWMPVTEFRSSRRIIVSNRDKWLLLATPEGIDLVVDAWDQAKELDDKPPHGGQ